MNISPFARLCAAAAIGLAALPAAHAQAQNYPTKPIRLLVPFGPGGVADVTARIVAQGLEAKLGKPVIVENFPGAGGIPAASQFVRATPDGYTLYVVSNQDAVTPSLFKNLPYDPLKQFAMVSQIGAFDLLLAVDEKSPYKNVKDVIDAAKKSPDRFNVGTIAVGSTQYLAAELFRSMAGLSVPTVPFKSTGEVISALRGGSVQAIFETVPAMLGQKGGGVRIIALASNAPNPLMKGIPTIAESGVPGYVAGSWNGIAAPVGTPTAILDKLNKAVHDVVADPVYNKKLVDIGNIPHTQSRDEFQRMLSSETDKWRKVIETAHIEKQ